MTRSFDPVTDLAAAAELPGVAQAAANARTRVDELLFDRALRPKAVELAADVALGNAHASTAMDGVEIPITAWLSGDALDDSAMGRVAAGVWRLETKLRDLVPVWSTAPLQALAQMHTLVASDVATPDELGRPRSTDDAEDPLRLRSLVPADEVPPALAVLARMTQINSAKVPAVVEAAVVHGELLRLRPFRLGSGPVARGAGRLVMSQRGLDPDLLLMNDAATFSIGRPGYVDAARGYISGEPDGVARWLRFVAESVAVGARMSSEQLHQL